MSTRQNEILLEVWRNRDEFAKRHNYNLNAMVATLQEMEQHPWNAIVDRRKETPNKGEYTGGISRKQN